MEKNKNVTLSLPAPLLHRFKIYAASHNQSMSSLMAQAVDKLMEQDGDWEAAKSRFVERMHNPPDLGTGGKMPWTKDELHAR